MCLAIGVLAVLVLNSDRSPKRSSKQVSEHAEKIGELEKLTDELTTKVAELESIRDLQRYANEAISEGYRSGLSKLEDYYKEPKFPALKAVANAEIIRVESYYITTKRFRAFHDKMPFTSEKDPVGSLARILLDVNYDWAVRARAATLLSEYEKNAVAAKALANAANTDPNLYVVQEAIFAFAKVTGFHAGGVFDSNSVMRWWARNGSQMENQTQPEQEP